MSAPIRLTTGFDRRNFRRALTGWWQSAVPNANFASRAIRWALIWGGLAALTVVLGYAGIEPVFVLAGMIGAGVLVLAFAVLQRTRMGRFTDRIALHWEAAGEAEVVFDEAGLVMEDAVSRLELRWEGVEAVRAMRGGTVFRSGMRMIWIPDADLPQGLKPRAFRAAIRAWRMDAAEEAEE